MSLMTTLSRSDIIARLTQRNINKNGQRIRENTGYEYMEQTIGTKETTGEHND